MTVRDRAHMQPSAGERSIAPNAPCSWTSGLCPVGQASPPGGVAALGRKKIGRTSRIVTDCRRLLA